MGVFVLKVVVEYDDDEKDTAEWYVDECLGRDAYDTPGITHLSVSREP
jgi:hypothetical protein